MAPLFVLDPTLLGRTSRVQLAYLGASLTQLSDRVDGLHLVEGTSRRRGVDDPPSDYPAPIVDHAEERREALRRHDALRDRRGPGLRTRARSSR